MLAVTARLETSLENVHGLAIKESLEDIRGEEVNPGRLYPNLDELAGMGILEKEAQSIDGRTNSYRVTVEGFRLLDARRIHIEGAVDGGDEEQLRADGGRPTEEEMLDDALFVERDEEPRLPTHTNAEEFRASFERARARRPTVRPPLVDSSSRRRSPAVYAVDERKVSSSSLYDDASKAFVKSLGGDREKQVPWE